MIVIQQAIYGEVQGRTSGHDLLVASEGSNKIFNQVSGKTDMSDRPEGSVLSGPVLRGFFAENHFLLIKTFPDISSGIRPGRVFSHALFIPQVDLHLVYNLSNLFQYHLSGIQKEAQMLPIEYEPQDAITRKAVVNEREAVATNALMESEPIVWLGEQGYWEWITQIWPKIPAGVKQKLKIGAAFGPSHAKGEDVNVLYIPEDAKTLWERHSFRVIAPGESGVLQSAAAHWLVGNTKEAAPFQLLVDDFAPQIESFEKINQLQDHGKAYLQIDGHPALNRLLVLANFVSRVSPNERLGLKGKNSLMAAILKAIPDASVKMFMALTHQSWKGFPSSILPISDAVRDWLTNNLLEGESAKECGRVLVNVYQAKTRNWWTKTVLEYLAYRLKQRQPSDAPVLWQWMFREPDLITQHKLWLPDDTEKELAQRIPKLEAIVAESILLMTKQKNWLLLHAKVAARHHSARKAIEAQLRIDTDESHTAAFEALSEIIKESAFVPIAASHTDVRLYHIAGKLILDNNKLLKEIKITHEGWLHCWEAAIKQGSEVWAGIPNPQETMFEVLDYLLAGNAISESLLNTMSSGKHSSLKDYPERESIWDKLPPEALSGFIAATLAELIEVIADGKSGYNNLEAPLKNSLKSQEMLQNIISSKTIGLTQKIGLFYIIPGLKAQHAKHLMQVNRFSVTDAEGFGRLVSEKKWTAVADTLYNRRIRNRELVPALLKCCHLLDPLQRLSLWVSGLKNDAITPNEWWEMFLSKAVEKYPLGPTEKGLWLSAGGKLEDLHYYGAPGKQSWTFALNHIRRGGSPSAIKILKEMRKEYNEDAVLIQLIQRIQLS
jgi:formiminotetrahydrofolate cyclodeaminase